MKKKIALILSALLSVSVLATACQPTDERNYVSTQQPSDEQEHLVSEEKRLHRKTVTEVGREFVVNGETDYVIIVGDDSMQANEGATFVSKQIGYCTGVTPNVYKDTNQDFLIDDESVANRTIVFSETAKYVVFSHEALATAANVVWATDADLGYSGYMIQSSGDSVFLKVNTNWGYQMAALAFCREVLGYEWYAEDTIVYTKSGETLPTMNIVEKPDYDFTYNAGFISTSGRYASGRVYDKPFALSYGGKDVHNSLDYISPTKYNAPDKKEEYHPLWFATKAGASSNGAPKQLCYSAHGVQSEYDLLLQTAYEGIMWSLDKYPEAAAVTFTREDAYGNCECDTCSLISEQYAELTATYVMFCNDLDDLVQAELQRRADESGKTKRDITILFFAYQEMDVAPVFGTDASNYVIPKSDVENGKNIIIKNGKTYVLPYNRTYENGLKCNPNVGCYFAPINAKWEESFYHSENKEYRVKAEKWSLLTDRLWIWMYNINHDCQIVPFKTFDALPETLRFFKEKGAVFMFNQMNHGTVATGFSEFKKYLTMNLTRDVNQNVKEMTDKYFENYFGSKNGAMRQYYDSLNAYMKQLEMQYPEMFYTAYKQYPDKPQYWSWATLQNWLDLCNQAYAEIETYKTSDPERYATMVKHIKLETVFVRYMICEYYTGYYTNVEAQAMRQSFCDDCKELDFTEYNHFGYTMSTFFDKWGVS